MLDSHPGPSLPGLAPTPVSLPRPTRGIQALDCSQVLEAQDKHQSTLDCSQFVYIHVLCVCPLCVACLHGQSQVCTMCTHVYVYICAYKCVLYTQHTCDACTCIIVPHNNAPHGLGTCVHMPHM